MGTVISEKAKHVRVDIAGASPTSLHFHAGSKDHAEAIIAKLELSKSLASSSASTTAPRDSERANSVRQSPALPPGKYLVKIYIDAQNKFERQYPATLASDDLVGQVEVSSRWPGGYGTMTVARFPAN